MRQRMAAWFLVGVLLVLMSGAGTRATGQSVKNPDTFVTLRYGDPESLDPAYQYDTASYEVVYPNVYETLIGYNGSVLSTYVPRLATEVPSLANGLISKDGLTYTFPIRPGVKFHDGTTMTPEDVRYSTLRFMLQDRDGGPSWLLLSPLVGKESTRDGDKIVVTYAEAAKTVTVQGNNVVFHLAHPYGAFLSIVAAWSFVMPKAWAAAHGDWDGSAGTWQKFNNPKLQDRYAFDHMNGTGPFKLVSWDRQAKEVDLARHDAYWRAPARLSRVVIRDVAEFTNRRLQLQQGDADLIEVDRSDQSKVMGMTDVTIRDDLPRLLIQVLHFNFKIDPTANPDIGSGKLDGSGIPPEFFSDVHVRKAFAYAFDYGTFIRDAYRGKAIQPSGPIIQGLLGYDPSLPKYTFDKNKAAAEFKEAFNTGNTARQIGAQVIKDAVESLNPKFKVDIRNLQWSSFLQLTNAHKGTLYALGWAVDYPDPDDFAQPFLSSKGDYPHRNSYNNPEADRLIKEAAVSSDPAKRKQLYKELTQIAYNDVPSIWAAQPTAFKVMRSWVRGWYWNTVYGGEDYYPLAKQ
ncbi:MAG: ABC transporter substrate-binding protein [Bacillati bacterium ANGP1]|uniref:ABC transporter substrate-binding protein n=1 Tax=Candidatus Segetimicrobium genomatis TaxID=2569760 RepID=A0A537JFD2_9BACT|nr:MAG: ABC transporter substrate-binding protein [Terrabacteria group bacterium ANGP1]